MKAAWVRAGIVVLVASCSAEAPPEIERLPIAHLSGSARALERLLVRLEEIRGTPLAAVARALRERTADCIEMSATVSAREERPLADVFLEAAECEAAPGGGGPPELAFVAPLGPDARLVGTMHVDPDGRVALRGHVRAKRAEPWMELLRPASDPPGPPALAVDAAILHLRHRPAAGIDVAALVPEGSQADRLFGLRAAIFSSAVLSGTVELAVYPPGEGHKMPLLALALGVRSERAARAALDQFAGALEARWPVHRREVSGVDGAKGRGTCFPDLRILPDLSPCYLVRDDVVIVGWNAASLGTALRAPTRSANAAAGGAVLHFDQLAEADAALSSALTPHAGPLDLAYAWSSARLSTRDEQGKLTVAVDFDVSEHE